MTKSLFRQSFLIDTLDFDIDATPAEQVLPNGVTLKLHHRGVLEVVPAYSCEATKNIVISCGIHGDETAPMEVVDSIIKDIESSFQEIDARCLFIIAHPQATRGHTRFIDENLNRLFDDKDHPQTKELVIADTLKLLVKDFYHNTERETRWHLDLHCAIRASKHYTFAVSPKTRHPVRSRALIEFLDSAHIEALLLSNSPSSTFSWFTADNYGAQAVTLELGRVAKIGENQLEKLTAFDLAVRNLIAQTQAEHLSKPCTKYRVSRTIVRLNDNFDFMFGEDVENFTSFVHGEVFGHDGDKPLMAKNENEAIVFPNRHVAVGQRAALMVCEVKTRYEDGELVYD